MIDWVIVSILIFFGLSLIGVELLFIPGTTFVGIIGVLCTGYGVYLGYSYFGSTIGTMVLIFSLLVSVSSLYYSFNSGIWERFTLRNTITATFNEKELVPELYEEGVTLSTLRPYGKVEFPNGVWEVKGKTQMIEAGEKVKVVKVEGRKVIVERIQVKT